MPQRGSCEVDFGNRWDVLGYWHNTFGFCDSLVPTEQSRWRARQTVASPPRAARMLLLEPAEVGGTVGLLRPSKRIRKSRSPTSADDQIGRASCRERE